MPHYRLSRSQFINRPLAEVFKFFERPENLEIITPPWLRFVVKTPSPIVMRKGAEIRYVVRPFLFSMKWTSRISEYDPPRSFVDEQIVGPYSLWHHTHRFRAEGNGTRVEDEVRYALPFGWVGRIVHKLKVRRQLEEIFDFRERVLKKVFA